MDESGDKNRRALSSDDPIARELAERGRLARKQVAEQRMADMRTQLARAIAERREVRLVYGTDLSLRLVLPHAVGISTSGKALLLAWQVDGASQTASTGWKHFALDRLRVWEVSDATFRGFAPGYDPENTSLAEVWQAL